MPDLEVLGVALDIDLSDVDALLFPRRPGAIGTDEAAEPAHEDTEGPDTTEEVEEQAAPATSWSAPLAAVTLLCYLNDDISERLGVDFELGHVDPLRSF